MNKPDLSIVIPVYNVDLWINECLDSIQRQTFVNWECILVDDGSTDFSGLICDMYAKKDPRFRVIHQSNAGVSAARNAGIEAAKSNWWSLIDPDDNIPSDYYAVMIGYGEHYGAECICSDFVVVKEGEELRTAGKLYNLLRGGLETTVCVGEDQIINKFLDLCPGGGWAYVFLRNLWGDYRFPVGVDLVEDVATFPIVAACAKVAVYTTDTVYYYRKRPGSLMSKHLSKERYSKSVQATTQMYNAVQAMFPDNTDTFLAIKLNSDLFRLGDYVKSNPESVKDRSKLSVLFGMLDTTDNIDYVKQVWNLLYGPRK